MNTSSNNMNCTSAKLKGEYSQFIGSYSGIYTDEFCDEIIKTFDYYQSINGVYCEDTQFDDSNAGRFDWAFDLDSMTPSMDFNPLEVLYGSMQECLNEYQQVFGTLKRIPMYSIVQKVQKTPPGGGYHVWHDENSSLEHCKRVIVWMVYLNDNFKGGETEFLYYKRREQPEKGKLLLWPSGYTHTHRGGMVLEGNKYVITGWFLLGGDNA